MNRLAHLLTGNINAWAGVAAVVTAPVLLSVQRGSVGVVEETLAAVTGAGGRREGRADRPGRRQGSHDHRAGAQCRGDVV